MVSIEPGCRRIITIDDNIDIHRDFGAVLAGAPSTDNLAEFEQDLFGINESEAHPLVVFDHDFATQGEEGVEKIVRALSEGQPFMLAFVDMRMPPGWDGLETIRRMWSVDPRIQAVICTAYSDYSVEEIARRFRSSDSLLILKKPFDPAEVVQMANALTQKWRLAEQAALRMAELQEMVVLRTRELEDTNRKLCEEVTRRIDAEKELVVMSRTDSLTGLYNRRVFDEYLQCEWLAAFNTGEPLSLILIDIDNFKAYNDQYGHVAGDECLRRVADGIASAMRRERDLLARYGGEEFVLILPNTNPAGALRVAGRVISHVQGLEIPHEKSPVGPHVTVSVGCATITSADCENSAYLIRKADESLYRAKGRGRNTICCWP